MAARNVQRVGQLERLEVVVDRLVREELELERLGSRASANSRSRSPFGFGSSSAARSSVRAMPNESRVEARRRSPARCMSLDQFRRAPSRPSAIVSQASGRGLRLGTAWPCAMNVAQPLLLGRLAAHERRGRAARPGRRSRALRLFWMLKSSSSRLRRSRSLRPLQTPSSTSQAVEPLQQVRVAGVAEVLQLGDRVQPVGAAGVAGDEDEFVRPCCPSVLHFR